MKKILLTLLVVLTTLLVNAQTRQTIALGTIAEMKSYRGTATFIQVLDSATGKLFSLYTGGTAADERNIFAGVDGRKWRGLPDIAIAVDSPARANSNNPVSSSYFKKYQDSIATVLSTIEGGTGGTNPGLINRLAYYAAAGSVVDDLAAITANRAVISDANGLPTHSPVTATQLSYVGDLTSAAQAQLNTKAPLASPTFTGIPTGPTAAHNTKTTQFATTDFVQRAKDSLVANSDVVYTIRFTTTDATPVNVDTFALSNGQGVLVNMSSQATLDGGAAGYASIKAVNFIQASGTVTMGTIRTLVADEYIGSGLSTASVTTTRIATNSLGIIQATGEASKTINWVITYTPLKF